MSPWQNIVGLAFVAQPSVIGGVFRGSAASQLGRQQTDLESSPHRGPRMRRPLGFLQMRPLGFLAKPSGGAAKRGEAEGEQGERVDVSKWPLWLKVLVFGFAGVFLSVFFGWVVWLFCTLWNRYRAIKGYHEKADDGDANKITFKGYVKYRFAYWFVWTEGSNGIIIVVLVILSLIFGAVLYCYFVGTRMLTSVWITFVWLVAPDAGAAEMTHTGCVIGALMSIVGLVLFALLLTLMQDSFAKYLDQIRNGSSCVMETGHMLLIGITENTMPIIPELCKAYEVCGGTTIVVLSSLVSKPEMEERISEMGFDMLGSRIVVRAGKPSCHADLKMVSADAARSIVIMADREESKEMRDAYVMRALLTICGNGWPVNGRILAVCSLLQNKPLLEQTGGPKTDVVMLDSFVGKLMVQCSKHQGLGTIVKSAFGFEGSEFYITPIPDHLQGLTVANAALHYPSAVVCGVMRSEEGCTLCPGNDYVLKEGEEIVLLATDSSCVVAEKTPAKRPQVEHLSYNNHNPRPSPLGARDPEKILIMGWNETTGCIVAELDGIVPRGTEVVLVSPRPAGERDELLPKLENITQIKQVQGRLGSRYMLEELPDNAVAEASRIFILGDEDASGPKDADTSTIGVLMQVRDILLDSQDGTGAIYKIPIVPEIQDPESETHCQMIQASDFIDTSGLPSQILAMIAYNPQIAVVLEEILAETTNVNFAFRRLQDYIQPGTEPPSSINFVQVQYLAGNSGEVVLGWSRSSTDGKGRRNQIQTEFQLAMQDQASCSGLVVHWEINPEDKVVERAWDAERDKLVVLCTQGS